MSSKSDCGCRKTLKAVNNAIAHIEWLTRIREAADTVVREYKMQWPIYRLTQAIEILEITLQDYDEFTSNNEQSRIDLPEMSNLCEPREGG